MTRNFFIFLGTFVLGAVIALVVRAAAFKPNADPATHASHSANAGDYAPQVSNPLAPSNASTSSKAAAAAGKTSAVDSHANHGAAAGKSVNSVCAICGMDVDPSLPTLQYKGQTIGFGCKMCAPKFKADPDRYGPLYLKNETVKR
jgi:YHS domain-containing protein